jgi:hypothetical protein
MASEIKSDKLSPSGGTALQIGDASDTITIPTGATFTITDGLSVASGSTGQTSWTAGDVLYATGTTALAKLAKGTAEQVLSMNSGATAPEWATAAATAGGTGQTGFTAGDILYANSTTTLTKLGKGTAEQVLAMNSGATAPDWGSVDLTVLPTITVAKGGTNLSSFTAGDILYATGSTTLAKLAKGSGSDTLKMNSGATAPEWVTVAAASSDYVLIEGNEISGTPTSIDFQGCFTSTYDNYILRWNGLQLSSSYPVIGLLDSSNNHLGSDTHYSKQDIAYGNWTTYSHFYNTSTLANGWQINYDYGYQNTDEQGYGYATFWNPLSTSVDIKTTWTSSFSTASAGTVGFVDGTGYWNGTQGAATGIRFTSATMSAAFTDIGNIAIYGLKHA